MAGRNDKLRATAWAADTLLFCADNSACDQAPRNDDDDDEDDDDDDEAMVVVVVADDDGGLPRFISLRRRRTAFHRPTAPLF